MRGKSFSRRYMSGVSAVEILIGAAISLLLLAGIATLFVNSRQTYENNDRLARIQENGRFALETVARDIRNAGYLGCAKRTSTKPVINRINTGPGSLLWDFSVPVSGFEATAANTWTPSLTGAINTAGPASLTDVLVVRGPKLEVPAQRLTAAMGSLSANLSVQRVDPPRMAANDLAVAANCDQATIFRITGYTAGATGNPDVIAHASGGTTAGLNSAATLGSLFPATNSEVYPVQTSIYYIDTATSGDGTSLWRIRTTGTTTTTEEIVEGVDTLQTRYGVDTNGNRQADTYQTADAVTNWDQVVSVNISLLVRSAVFATADSDAATRTLLGQSVGPFNDKRQRMVFATTVSLRNKTF